MSATEIACWLLVYDPNGRMSELQRILVKSALMRDDVRTAKSHLHDWRIT